MIKNYVVCLSGGLDSATVLALLKRFPHRKQLAVSFRYGSKHNELELESAKYLAEYYEVPHKIVDARGLYDDFRGAMMDASEDIPQGHYSDESMAATVVPMRNVTFASIAAGIAINSFNDGKPFTLGMGVHAGDAAVYPDCRPDTICALDETILAASDGLGSVYAPLLGSNKTDIVEVGIQIGVPFRLTRTCYSGHESACGLCGSCNERLEAFKNNSMIDPVVYQTLPQGA